MFADTVTEPPVAPVPALMDMEPPCWPAPLLEPAITDTEPADPDNESPDATFTVPDEPEAVPLDIDTEPEPALPTEEARCSNINTLNFLMQFSK